MKKPESVGEFISVVKSMAQRERLVFDLNQQYKDQYAHVYAESVEVYFTILHDIKGAPKNINVKICTLDGKLIKNEAGKTLFNKSKYVDRCDDEYFTIIYNLLG